MCTWPRQWHRHNTPDLWHVLSNVSERLKFEFSVLLGSGIAVVLSPMDILFPLADARSCYPGVLPLSLLRVSCLPCFESSQFHA
jgi:hypothetical protein